MSRRDGNLGFNLYRAIDEYKESKDKENALKKANGEKYAVTMSKTAKQKLNEDLAIEIIKENLDGALLASVIKQKEYIDEDALEKLVYNGDFDITKLAKAEINTTTYSLRTSVIK